MRTQKGIGCEIRSVRRALQENKIDKARVKGIGDFMDGGLPAPMPLGIVTQISGDTRFYPPW